MTEEQVKQEFIFKFEKIYVKDVSFESPSAPRIFGREKTQDVTIECDVEHRPLEDTEHFYDVLLTLKVGARQEDMTSFLVEVQQGGVFHIAGMPDNELLALLEVHCPTALMPFAREVICDLIVKGGFPQLVIDPINFQARYDHKLAAAKKQA